MNDILFARSSLLRSFRAGIALALLGSVGLASVGTAHAQQGPAPIAPAGTPAAPAAPSGGGPTEEQKAAATAKYSEGVELVKKFQWSEGLAAFEASYKIAPTPAALFNIGTCERALGRYVRGRDTLTRALAEDQARGGKLPESTVTEARGYISEMDRVIATLTLTIAPAGAAIAIDGRPLSPVTGSGANGVPRVAAGVAPVGSSRVDLQACKLEYSIVSPK